MSSAPASHLVDHHAAESRIAADFDAADSWREPRTIFPPVRGRHRLEQMLADPEPADRHDLMNVLAALRGYAEMLREDIGAQQPELDDTLASLLQSVQTAASGNSRASADESRDIQSEPGFILAVDDRRKTASWSPATCPAAVTL